MSKERYLNQSIVKGLRSYPCEIQIQENRSGSLFQMQTKATFLPQVDGDSPAWFHPEYDSIINFPPPEKENPQVCFDYIHKNPVAKKWNLAESFENYKHSSASNYVCDSGTYDVDVVSLY